MRRWGSGSDYQQADYPDQTPSGESGVDLDPTPAFQDGSSGSSSSSVPVTPAPVSSGGVTYDGTLTPEEEDNIIDQNSDCYQVGTDCANNSEWDAGNNGDGY